MLCQHLPMRLTRREFGALFGVASSGSAASRGVARVQTHNGAPALFINGEPQAPAAYYIPIPLEQYIRPFAKAGVHLYAWGWGATMAHVCRS